MPRIECEIVRAWWHADHHAEDRIHYVIVDPETGRERHLIADRFRGGDQALWRVLKDRLDAVGYQGPRRERERLRTRPVEDVALPPVT